MQETKTALDFWLHILTVTVRSGWQR